MAGGPIELVMASYVELYTYDFQDLVDVNRKVGLASYAVAALACLMQNLEQLQCLLLSALFCECEIVCLCLCG